MMCCNEQGLIFNNVVSAAFYCLCHSPELFFNRGTAKLISSSKPKSLKTQRPAFFAQEGHWVYVVQVLLILPEDIAVQDLTNL